MIKPSIGDKDNRQISYRVIVIKELERTRAHFMHSTNLSSHI